MEREKIRIRMEEHKRKKAFRKKLKRIRALVLLLMIIFGVAWLVKGIFFRNSSPLGNVSASSQDEKLNHNSLFYGCKSDDNVSNVFKFKLDTEEDPSVRKVKRQILENDAKNAKLSEDERKLCYLSFDDGPTTTVTPKILDTLDRYGVKATFFVIGNLAVENQELLKREFESGHKIGNHSYSHKYDKIYKSPETLLSEIDQADKAIKSILGSKYENKTFRFPGGSFGKKKSAFRDAVNKAGWHFYDWNCLNGDAEAKHVSKDKLLENLKSTSAGKRVIYILMHDASGKDTTAEALPEALEYLASQGYSFKLME